MITGSHGEESLSQTTKWLLNALKDLLLSVLAQICIKACEVKGGDGQQVKGAQRVQQYVGERGVLVSCITACDVICETMQARKDAVMMFWFFSPKFTPRHILSPIRV